MYSSVEVESPNIYIYTPIYLHHFIMMKMGCGLLQFVWGTNHHPDKGDHRHLLRTNERANERHNIQQQQHEEP